MIDIKTLMYTLVGIVAGVYVVKQVGSLAGKFVKVGAWMQMLIQLVAGSLLIYVGTNMAAKQNEDLGLVIQSAGLGGIASVACDMMARFVPAVTPPANLPDWYQAPVPAEDGEVDAVVPTVEELYGPAPSYAPTPEQVLQPSL